jgi:hypothetical protein
MGGAANMPDLSEFLPSQGGGAGAGGPGGDYSASSATGDQGILSGLGDLFSSVGTAVAQDYRAVQSAQGPRMVGSTGLVYNPATGQYTNANAINAQNAMSPLILLLLIGGVAYLLLRK